MKQSNYIKKRKKFLKEEVRLVCEREKLSNALRSLRSDMRAWDRALVRLDK